MNDHRNFGWTRREFVSTTRLLELVLFSDLCVRQSPLSHRLRRLESSWCRPLVCARHPNLWLRSFCMEKDLLKYIT